MARPESREEYRKTVTEAFLRALEEDGLGWKKMWTSGAETPVNGVTGREYSGINRFWLSLTAAGNGWNDPRWVTMTQIMDRQNRYHKGKTWHLQKGSKATYVEYWYRYDCAAGRTVTWQEYSAMIASGRDPDEFRLVPRYTAVFNACQIDGIDPFERPQLTEAWQDELIDDIAAGLGVSITYDGETARSTAQRPTAYICRRKGCSPRRRRSTRSRCMSLPIPPDIPEGWAG